MSSRIFDDPSARDTSEESAELTAKIPLSQDKWAIVDADDFERVRRFKWSAIKSDSSRENWYAVRQVWVDSKPVMLGMHRFILGAGDGVEVDHINGDGLDNRRSNLRLATHSQNQANRGKTHGRLSRYKGVRVYARSYGCNVWCRGVQYREGGFATEEDAARAYDRLARKLFGEYACLNFPDEREEVCGLLRYGRVIPGLITDVSGAVARLKKFETWHVYDRTGLNDEWVRVYWHCDELMALKFNAVGDVVVISDRGWDAIAEIARWAV